MGKAWKRHVVAYLISNILEDAVDKGILTQQECQKYCLMIGSQCGLTDLLPRRHIRYPDPETLKEDITSRLTPGPERSLLMADTVEPNQRGLILSKKEGELPPDDLIDKIVDNYPSMISSAWPDDNKEDICILTEGLTEKITPDSVKEIFQNFNKNSVTFFGHNDVAYREDDIQPYPIIEQDGKNKLVAFLSGDFNEFHHPESQYTDAFFAVSEYLKEQLTAIYEQQSMDVDKTMAILDTAIVRKQMNKFMGSWGIVSVMACNGKVLTFLKKVDQDIGEYKWGWISSKSFLKPAEGKTRESLQSPGTTVDTTKKLSPSEQLAALRAKKAAEKQSGTAAPPSVPSVKDAPALVPEKKTETAPAPSIDTELVKCPSFYGKGARKGWWWRHFPDHYATWKAKWDDPDYGLPYGMLAKDSPMRDRYSTQDKLRELIKSQGMVEGVLTVISNNQKKEFINKFLKQLNEKEDYIDDIQAHLRDTKDFNPSLADQTDWAFDKMIHLKIPKLRQLGQAHWAILAVAFNDARNFILKNMTAQMVAKTIEDQSKVEAATSERQERRAI